MNNHEIADAFDELADRLEVAGEQSYRVMAYRRAAGTLRACHTSLERLSKEKRLTELPGVGSAIEQKIADLLETGTFKALDRARAQVPDGLLQLAAVQGVGPKTASRIWQQIGAETVHDVVAAARAGRLETMKGIGPKTVEAIAQATVGDAHADDDAPAPRRSVVPLLRDAAEGVVAATEDLIAGDPKIEYDELIVGGELARGCDLINSLDLLLIARDAAAALTAVDERLARCGWEAEEDDSEADSAEADSAYRDADADSAYRRSRVYITSVAFPVRVSVAAPRTAAQAVALAIGPRSHALELIDRAGDIKGRARASGYDDARLYSAADLQFVEPELRDLPDAFERATRRDLPELLTEDDMQGDLHTHSTWSDGHGSILDMALAAYERGDNYLAVTDHSAPFTMVGGLDGAAIREQAVEIDAANRELAGQFTVLRGSEVEIVTGGGLGLDDETLATLDWVVASVHVGQRQSERELRRRVDSAMSNPLVDCIAHPTGRLLLRRPPASVDTDWLIERALETGTVLEINANPDRLDLNPELARQALAAGVLLAVNSDAHRTWTLDVRAHGVAIARRAGASPDQVVNCYSLDELQSVRKRNQ